MDHKIISNSVAFFDFDGTLTTKDSFIEFIKYYHGSINLLLGLLLNLPVLLLYKIKVIPNWKAKERLIQYFFKGVDLDEFNVKAREFSMKEIPKILRSDMMKQLKNHKVVRNDIFLVSASFENWLVPWAESHKIKVISSRLDSTSKKLNGKIRGNNCYGLEKELRIKLELDLSRYDKIYAYGDSHGDTEMLQLADISFYRGEIIKG